MDQMRCEWMRQGGSACYVRGCVLCEGMREVHRENVMGGNQVVKIDLSLTFYVGPRFQQI